MASGVNKVILMGNIGKDPDVRSTNGGSTITSISVATAEKWKDKSGQFQERTEWHRVKFFGKLAEIAGQYLQKGSQVYIEGSIRSDKYTDKDGVERVSYDIIASEMKMIGGKSDSRPSNSSPQQQSNNSQRQQTSNQFDDIDDEIPF